MIPGNAAALDTEGTEGGSNVQLASCESILGASPAERERRARRARLAREADRRRASVALDELLAVMYPAPSPHAPSGWELAWARQMVAQGFDAEYVARRYGLLRKGVAA